MEEKDIALKKVAKGVGIVATGIIISKVLSYVYRFVIARAGVEEYGLISIAIAVFSLLVTISLIGLGDGVIRFVSFYKGKQDERRIKGTITSSLKISSVLAFFLGLTLFFLSDWIAVRLFHNADLGLIFKVFAIGMPFDVLRNIFINSAKAFQRAEPEVYAKSILENVAKVVLTFIAIQVGFGITGVAIAYVLSIFLSFVLSFYFLEKKIFPIIKTSISSVRSERELLDYSIPLIFTSAVYLIIQWSDTIMLGSMKTAVDVGIYNVALPIAALLNVFPFAVRTLFFPVLGELYAQEKKHIFRAVYRSAVKWNIIVNSFLFITLICFSTQIIRILFGGDYVMDKMTLIGYSIPLSSLSVVVLSFGMILGDFLVPSKDVLMVLKKTKLIFVNTVIGAGLNILLNYLLIPGYGIVGAAIATALAHFVIVLMVGVESYIFSKINPFKQSCFKVLGLTVVILTLVVILKLYLIENLFYLVFVWIALFSAYFGLLVVIKAFDEEDIMILNSVLVKIRSYFLKG